MIATRTRPAALSAGAGALIAAWFVAGAIARLTGAPAVLALMAALLVAVIADVLAGFSTVRHQGTNSVDGPTTTTVGTDTLLTVTLDDHSRRTRLRRDGRLTVIVAGEAVGTSTLPSEEFDDGTTLLHCRFPTPGIVTELQVAVQLAGPLGLVWWRHTATVATRELHIAPQPCGPLVDTERTSASHDGAATAERGNHRGDVDGVRSWREGDPVGAVHWPSSLRAGDLIVHDRAAASDQQWTIDLDEFADVAADSTNNSSVAARVRATLDEGLRHGNDVAVRLDGERHRVQSDDDAARWSAWVAQHRGTPPHGTERQPFWKREINFGRHRSDHSEPATTVSVPARWAAGGAALASSAMLVGTLSPSPLLVAVIAGGMVAGVLVSLAIANRSGSRPRAMQIAIALAIVIALGLIAADARNVDGLLAALRGPMPHLLMLLVVLHGFEVVDRRTLRVHQAISFVVTAYAAGLRIDGALGWWIAVWGAAFFASLLLTTRSSHTSRHASNTRVRLPIRPAIWSIATGVVTLALLSVVPIPDGPARLGLPALSNEAPTVGSPGALAGADGNPAQPSDQRTGGSDGQLGNVVGYPGFTETLDTSVRGDLGDQVVMRVRSPQPAFWRGQTFTEFDGRTWTVSADTGENVEGPVIDVPPTLGDAMGVESQELIQTYFIETDLPNLVFAAYRPTQVIFDGSLWTRPDGALRSDVTLTEGSVYTVISDRIAVTADVLRAQGDVAELFAEFRRLPGSEILDPFLELPDSTTQRTIDLADSLNAADATTYDTILAYQDWLGANTEYDLDAPVPAEGDDAVDDFLFESQLGYCEQIASTLTIMLRSQGVPARLATGYVPGERDRVSGVWKVRARDAHAWVEVWFPQTGWEAFDPTASVPLAGDASTGTVGGDLVTGAVSSVNSHRVQLGVLALVAAVGWLLLRWVVAVRRRHRRGRWGVLQDRFLALDPQDEHALLTNPAIADRLSRLDETTDAAECAAHAVASTLDRAAFDPGWSDDDQLFAQTRSAIDTLERR